MRALRHPALGLVLVVLGLTGLLQPMFELVTVVFAGGDGLPGRFLALVIAPVAVGMLQVGTGVAIIRGRAPTVWFAAYLAACAGLTVLTALLTHSDEIELKLLLQMALETLGLPVLIIVASVIYRSEAFEDERSPTDVVAMLLVIAVRALTINPLAVAQTLRLMGVGTPGALAGRLVWPALLLLLGILALVAARRFTRRSLGLYVVAAIGVDIVMTLAAIAATLDESNYEGAGDSFRTQLIVHQLLALISVIGPLTLWWYAQERLASPEPAAPRMPSRVPIWLALPYVPMLLSRAFLTDEMTAMWGGRTTALVIAITGTMAVLLLVSADAAFRKRPAARWWTLASAVGGVAIVAAIILGADDQFRAIGRVEPLVDLVACTTVAAWLYRALR